GSAGRVAQVKSAQPVTFSSIDQASDMVVAISFHDHVTDEIVWLAAWTPADPWAAGDSPTISPGNITQAFTA
ncbi:MAG TPA: hypothetical protein VFL73_10990, partial [Solirubrobacteraceae bacterium]|nr:hypothetical protein [Solirubrobacteraceae bacterium]